MKGIAWSIMRGRPWSLVVFYLLCFRCYQQLHHFLIPLFRKKNDPKVFCIGDVKTGTTSVSKALSILGYRSVHWPRLGVKPKDGWIQYIKKCNYDAYADWPMIKGELYQEIDKEIPNSKFILTMRGKESFEKSYVNYFKGTSWEIKNPQQLKQILQKYEERNKQIIEYFKDKPSQLLVMNIIEGDGWDKLCNFLDKPIPNKPFPNKNKGKYKKENEAG
jgi:hypothetical protein